jgi:ribosomal protein S18 acetylase RimI-like enzyme
VVQYRSFRNDDPPGLVDIWNDAFTGRGAVLLRHSSPLERFIFSKPYFDAAGLIVAVEDGLRIGFVHAGFGSNAKESALAPATGVICAIGVRSSHRRRGIGSRLLERAEGYLRERGARTIYAGAMRPLNPFYFGLYGGSESSGFLASDKAAAPFLEYHGYRPWDTCLVFQRHLDQPVNVVDARFVALRRRLSMRVLPNTGIASWWQECVQGVVEPVEFRLEETVTSQAPARAQIWEMEGFSWRWGLPSVGLLDLEVNESQRRQGFAKFLLVSILQYLQEQYFGLIEVQTMERNQAAVKLYQGVGFEQVDIGRIYRREPGGAGGP